MDIGFALPVSGAWATRDAVVDVARTAERLGYSSLWTFSRLLVPTTASLPPVYSSVLDPVVTLAAAAAVTERVRLGTAIVNMPFQPPAVLAKQAVTLDVLSGGRLDLGLGLGWVPEEFEAVGVPFERRGARAEEYLACLRALWSADPVEFEGEFYRVPPSSALPKPVQAPHPPVWLGGAAVHGLLDHVVEYGDGWMPIYRDANQDAVDQLQRACEAAGRDPATVTLGVYAPYPDVEHLEGLAGLGFEWAALLVRPHPAADERRKLDEYQHLVDHFGASV